MATSPYQSPLLIYNPVSGKGRAIRRCEQDSDRLSAYFPNLSIYRTARPGDYSGIREAIDRTKPDVLISMGGDGTLNDVVNASDARIPIAVVPMGSGNDFAELLGIRHQADLIDRLKKPVFRRCDLGNCNGLWFVNGLGIGFDGEIARRTVSNTSRLPSILKYYLAIVRSLLFYKESESTIEWDKGNAATSSFLMITVANGRRYGGSFRVAPPGQPDDGRLDLVLIEKVHPLLRIIYLPLVILGKHLTLSFVQHHLVSQVKIHSHGTLPAHTDGELMVSSQYNIVIHPKKLDFVL